jgi:hypothetical protein
MMRYRSSTTTPGVKRPWSIDPEEVSQPLVVVFGPLGPLGEDASLVAPLALLPRTVSASDGWSLPPHEAQNLAPVGTVAWQLGHCTGGS